MKNETRIKEILSERAKIKTKIHWYQGMDNLLVEELQRLLEIDNSDFHYHNFKIGQETYKANIPPYFKVDNKAAEEYVVQNPGTGLFVFKLELNKSFYKALPEEEQKKLDYFIRVTSGKMQVQKIRR